MATGNHLFRHTPPCGFCLCFLSIPHHFIRGKAMSGLPVSLALSLCLALVLECGFFFLTGKRHKKDLLLVILVNVLTNPIVVLSYWLAAHYTLWNRNLIKVFLELFAVLTEACYYKKYGQEFRHPLWFSIAANAFSFGIGVVVQQFL